MSTAPRPHEENDIDRIVRTVNRVAFLVLGILLLVTLRMALPDLFREEEAPAEALAEATTPAPEAAPDGEGIENGIHVETGFVVADNWELVRATCTACHSSKLVIQNRADRDGWLKMIRWMQKTQNLWDLGENEGPILDYLSTYYAPQRKGRRARLTNIQWYELEP